MAINLPIPEWILLENGNFVIELNTNFMNAQELKYSILDLLRETHDPELLAKFYQTLLQLTGKKAPKTASLVDENEEPLTPELFEALIDEAIADIEAGKVISHAEMKKRLNEKYRLAL